MRHMLSRTFLAIAVSTLAVGQTAAEPLKAVIQKTLGSSPEVATTANERDSRVYEVDQARAGYYPTVDFAAGIGQEWTTTAATGNSEVHLTRRETSLSLRQMLFDSYATPSEVERQKARVNSAAHTVMGTAQDIALQTTNVYLELLKQQQLLSMAESNLAIHKKIYEQIKRRADSGVANMADLKQIEGRLALAESNVIAGENNVREARANYIRVTGEQPGDIIFPPTLEGKLPANIDEALQRALANHPTLASANADIDAAKAQHAAARHNDYPRLHFEVDKTLNENIDGIRGDSEDLTAMLRLRWNLYNGGRDKARRKQTAELIEEAKSIRNRTHRQVEQTLRLAWAAHTSTVRQREFLRKHMESVSAARDVYTRQFNIGQRSLLDLLDTENEVFEARRAYLDADYANLFAQYRIFNAMGSLLQQLEVEPPTQTAKYQER